MRTLKLLILCLLTAAVCQTARAGMAVRLWYTAPGNFVTNITVLPGFPDNAPAFNAAIYYGYDDVVGPIGPDLTYLTTGLGDNTSYLNNYGTLIRGWIEAPQDGPYRFYIYSDDNSELWLSSNTSPANKVKVAEVIGASGRNAYPRTAQRSDLITLLKGQKYYYEVYTKEGGGDDYFGVGWQLPDGTLDRPVSSRHLIPWNQVFTGMPLPDNTNVIQTVLAPTFTIPRYFGFNQAPTLNNLLGSPTNYTVGESSNYTFQATVMGAQPMTMQWFRTTNNGTFVAIPGANLQHYTITNAQIAVHNNTQYQLRVTNANGNASSFSATLLVSADTTKPTLLSANTYGRTNGLTVRFSEPMSGLTALDTNNYRLTNTVTGLGIKVLAVSFWGADQQAVNLVTETIPTVQALYTVIVNNVKDNSLANNTILPNSSVQFNSVFQDNLVTLRYFEGVNNGAVLDLTNSSIFINNLPTRVETRNLFEGPTTFADNYGIQYVGYFIPPSNGVYTFYVSSDDQSLLWLSSNESPLNKRAIATEPNNSGVRVWFNGNASRTTTNNGNYNAVFNAWNPGGPLNAANLSVSLPQTLQGNTRYYIEYLTKEGGGGDNGAVAVGWADNPILANNQSPITADMLSTTNVGGIPISITSQPTNTTVADQANAVFRVTAIGTAPTFQWYRGNLSSNVPIADATGATLTTDPITFQDQGAQFFVIVQNGFSAATSSVATLTVITDTVKPTLVRAKGNAEFRLVTVSFSERLNRNSATNAANYSIDGGLTVLNAALGQGLTNVVLTTTLQNTGTVYTVTVNNVQDSSSASNAIAAASQVSFTSFVLTRGFALREYYLNIGGNTDVPSLTTAGTYPDFPDVVDYISTNLSHPQTVPDLNNYGVRISGTITPLLFDFYKFLITSDDASMMFIGTNNVQSSVNVDVFTVLPGRVAQKDGANQALSLSPFDFDLVPMNAGEPRAYQLLMKEGGGGDFVRAAWLGGFNTPSENFNSTAFQDALPSIPNVYLAVYADPAGAMVGVSVQPIAAITTNEVFTTTMSLTATGAITGVANPPLAYIWQRKRTNDADFKDMPAGNGFSVFTTPRLQFPADAGARYRCLVSVPGASTLSAETVLTIGQDLTAPTIVRSYGSATFNTATIAFNEPIDIGLLSGLSIVAATNGVPLSLSNPRIVDLTNLVVTTSLQATNTRYNVLVSGVRDIAFSPNMIPANSATSFTSWMLLRGGAAAERYLNIGTATGAGGLDVLRNLARFRVSPDQKWYMNQSFIPQSGGVDLRTAGASPSLDGFGGRLYGWIIPPTNGNYVFYLNTDDSSELRLSTDADPANQVLIMGDRASCCQGVSDTFANIYPLTSTAARVLRWTNSLSGGQAYYFEVMYKEGGGGDNLNFVWKDVNNTAAPSATGYIQASNLASIVNPDDSSITFTPNLTNITVFENRIVVFNGTAFHRSAFTLPGSTTSDAVFYQWQSDAGGGTGFTNISGQTGPTFTRQVGITNNGYKFQVIATTQFPVALTSTSAVSILTVSADTARPVLTSIRRDAYFTNVFLMFDELLLPSSVTNVAQYSITNAAGAPLAVLSASLRDGTNVSLLTALQSTGTTYGVSITTNNIPLTNVISDLSATGTNLFGGTNGSFNSFVQVDGWLRKEFYLNNTAGTAISALTNDSRFKLNAADTVTYTNFANIPSTSPNLDNYGGKLYGLFRAPTNGDYTFFIRADDGSSVYLTTNGVRTVVAGVTACCLTYDQSNPLQNNSPASSKVVVSLTAGTYYPFEALFKEGGGGDFMEVAVTANGQPTPGTGGANTIPAPFLATFADPDLATLNITVQPAPAARLAGATATFSVTATGSSPLPFSSIRYQWRSNGVDILNATNASHTTPALTLGADGAQYTVRVALPEKALLSSAATLTVGTAPVNTAVITPATVVTNVGSNVTFTASGFGSPTPSPTFRWLRNNTNVSGGTFNPLVLNSVQFTNQGTYTVVISNALGSVTSAPATLQVLVTPYTLGGNSRTGTVYRSAFPTDAGRAYVVEYTGAFSNNPATTVWTLLTNVTGTGASADIADPNAPAGTNRFYRIRTTFP